MNFTRRKIKTRCFIFYVTCTVWARKSWALASQHRRFIRTAWVGLKQEDLENRTASAHLNWTSVTFQLLPKEFIQCWLSWSPPDKSLSLSQYNIVFKPVLVATFPCWLAGIDVLAKTGFPGQKGGEQQQICSTDQEWTLIIRLVRPFYWLWSSLCCCCLLPWSQIWGWWVDAELARAIISHPAWEALGSSRRNWKPLMGRGASGTPCLTCCHRDLTLDQLKKMDEWIAFYFELHCWWNGLPVPSILLP